MNTQTIDKINVLPSNLLSEVNDFVDFLMLKHKIKITNEEESLAEKGMGEYLENLNNYESLLAEGKIQW
jgi:hypothetical protein